MAKKLSEKDKENRIVEKAFKRIQTIGKDYGIKITRYACQRFVQRTLSKEKLEKDIKEKEKELQQLKQKDKK